MIEKLINEKQMQLADSIRILAYKEDSTIFSKIDFENPQIFLEPLLFAYFNRKQTDYSFSETLLHEIMQSHFLKVEPLQIKGSLNQEGKAYIPRLGVFDKKEQSLIEEIVTIENTNVEVVKYPIPLFRNIIRILTSRRGVKEEEIINDKAIFDKNIAPLTKAFQFIKSNAPDYFKLIEQFCKKCVLFKLDPIKRESFASINAHGAAFFNVYNENIDEVFFIDDIGRLSGRIIMTTLLHNAKAIFTTDHYQKIDDIIDKEDHRNIYTLFHSLFTYYTASLCLDCCIEGNCLTDKQKNEAISRMVFYIKKSEIDLENLEKVIVHFSGIENVLSSDGLLIYKFIKEKIYAIKNKRVSKMSSFDFTDLKYNTSFKNFTKTNPLV